MQKEIIEKIKEFDTIIIHRHWQPDGDALGSQIGLQEALKATFPNKKILVTGDISPKYQFIGTMDDVKDEDYNNALVIAVDCGNNHLISDERYKNGAYLIKIDHHSSGSSYANLNYVDDKEISCASLIARMIFDNNLKLTAHGAKALFTGLVTDSSRFLYAGVNSHTFIIASKLLDYDFSLQEIYDKLYIEDYQIIKLRAMLTLAIKFTSYNVAYIKTTYPELLSYNVDLFTVSRGMVNVMAGIKGVDIWVNFTEDKDGTIAVELRSSKYNINPIAVKYGGGGHKFASGAILSSFAQADLLLEDLNKIIMEAGNGR